ncbi:MAG: hypothetical protein HYS17_10205 [Micavibrio aeruginosavorus]|uniref:Uncharacterized protein n=1 Tax=Micavibrio aeruginosavorus TaxID=349221 RepID=A0A7T5R1U3_9BACT|nr:MAG: hypothetical protein HYS17_10205 [Micavibrio aeruginosavorus]
MNDSLPARIDTLIGNIEEAIRQVENGDLIDLGDLDDEVAAVCEAAHEPAPEETEEVDEKMDLMIKRLEELSSALENFEHTDDEDQ